MSRESTWILLTGLIILLARPSTLQCEEQLQADSRAFPGIQIGQTYWDNQHPASVGRMICSEHPDTLHLIWTNVASPGGSANVAYQSLVYDGYDWIETQPSGGIYIDMGSFSGANLSSWQNRAFPVYQVEAAVGSRPSKSAIDYAPSVGFFTAQNIPGSNCTATETGFAEHSYSWPKTAVGYDDYYDPIFHVITTEDVPGTEMKSLVYHRGTGDPPSYYSCGTFIDSVMTLSAVIDAEAYPGFWNPTVLIAYLAPRDKNYQTANPADNDVILLKSTDAGLSWWPPQNITEYQNSDDERAYGDLSILYSDDGVAHLVWTAPYYDPGTGTYSEQRCKLRHWDEFNDHITAVTYADNEQSCPPGAGMLNVAKPSLTECDGNLYVVYTRFTGDTDLGTEDCSAGGYANGDLYAQASTSAGELWGPPTNLTGTSSDGCTAGNCESENWVSTTKHNEYGLDMLYIGDTDAGSYVAEGEGSEAANAVMWYRVPCFEMEYYCELLATPDDFSTTPIEMEPDEPFDTSLTLEARGNFTIDYYINIDYISGTPGWLSVYPNAGSIIPFPETTEHFDVQLNSSGLTPGTYEAEIEINHNGNNSTIVIPVTLVCTGEPEYECGDVNLDGVVDVDDEADLYQYLFNGDDLDSLELGDVDQCGGVNCGDLSYWLEWEYWGGPAPCEGSVAYCDETREGCFIELGCPEYVYKGERVTVELPVYLTNDVPLIGVTLGFKHNSQDATGFTIGDAGGILGSWPPPQPSCEYCGYPENLKALYYFRGDGSTVLAPQSGGLAAYVSLTLPSSAVDQVINIDTATVPYLLEPTFVPLGNGVIRPHYYDCGAGEIFVGNCESGIGGDCYYITETGTGTDVDVDLGDVDLNFGEITSAGLTWMTITTTGETPPTGYVMQPADGPLYYNVATDAGYTGTIEICIDYSGRNIHPFDEPGLALFHYEGGGWVDITTSLDTDNDIICGQTTSLSPFILASLPLPSTLTTLDAMKDNTIYEENSNSNGSGSYFFAGLTEGELARRALIEFDIAGSIPAGARIDSVFLDLHMSRTQASDFDVSLYHVLEDWGEGASDALGQEGAGAPAETGDATWVHTFYDSDLWQNQGGYYYSQPAATIEVDQAGFYTWGPTPEMQFDVQNWLDIPADNFGWILIGYELGPSAKRFDSRENEVPANRPQLRVYYYTEQAPYICGDADGNEIVNISDAVYLIAYIFGGGPAPDPLLSGDADCNQIVNISDAVYLIAYIFGGGPAPCAECN